MHPIPLPLADEVMVIQSALLVTVQPVPGGSLITSVAEPAPALKGEGATVKVPQTYRGVLLALGAESVTVPMYNPSARPFAFARRWARRGCCLWHQLR